MPQLNSVALRRLRERQNLTLDELGLRARVDRGTISKIENGKRVECRHSTARKLAEALGVKTDALTGPSVEDPDDAPAFFARKSVLKLRMSDDARNALDLVALRFDVKPAQILHLAPFLFYWAAEASLRWRQERVDALDAQLDALSKVPCPKHLSGLVTDNWRGDAALEEERKSIAARDLFGSNLSDDALSANYEESEDSPIVQFFKTLAASLSDGSEFEYWQTSWDHMGYVVAKTEALALVGGDQNAAHHLIHGNASLHELAKEVRDQGPEAVANWVNEKGESALEEFMSADLLGIGGSHA